MTISDISEKMKLSMTMTRNFFRPMTLKMFYPFPKNSVVRVIIPSVTVTVIIYLHGQSRGCILLL